MHMPARQILARHQQHLHGRLLLKRIKSRALDISKPFYIYEPAGWHTLADLPLLYLFRGHEREWVNIREDGSRSRSTAIEDLDRLIVEGLLPPVLAVLPGLNSSNNWIPSLGINMVGEWETRFRGLGSGRFWEYLTGELMPAVARWYPQSARGLKLMAGFSLGGYTVSLIAAKLPGLFDHALIYDGTLMWPDHIDPRKGPRRFGDTIWYRSRLFDAALGRPRNELAMQAWNPTNMIRDAGTETLGLLRQTTFWVASAHRDGGFGNRDRARMFVDLLRARQIPTGLKHIIFDPRAEHTWHWTDRFLTAVLQKIFIQTKVR